MSLRRCECGGKLRESIIYDHKGVRQAKILYCEKCMKILEWEVLPDA